MDAGAFVREVRLRHGLDQRSLARRARTSQTQISRIERGEISPSAATLGRLLAVMGEGLELAAVPADRPNVRVEDLRRDLGRLTVAQRIGEAAELSYAATAIWTAAKVL